MIYHLVLCSLREDITSDEIEEMMRRTRMSLLKIDVALSVKCGRVIAKEELISVAGRNGEVSGAGDWEFFVAIEVSSMERLAAYREHPVYVKYMEEVLKPQARCRLVLDYEMDPQTSSGLLSRSRAEG